MTSQPCSSEVLLLLRHRVTEPNSQIANQPISHTVKQPRNHIATESLCHSHKVTESKSQQSQRVKESQSHICIRLAHYAVAL